MKAILWSAAGTAALALAACGGGGGGGGTVVATPNPEDGSFAIISRTTTQGVTWWVAPIPAGGAAGLNPDTPGAVQVGSASGEGGNTFRWTGRRSLALCANERTVEGPAQATVGGQAFTVAHACMPATPTPDPNAPSPFGTPITGAGGPAPTPPPPGPMRPPPGGIGTAPPPNDGTWGPQTGYVPTPAPPVQPGRSNLPPRRPGLWRTTIYAQNGQPPQQNEVCLTPERATNWTPDPQERAQCPQYLVHSEGQFVVGEATCNTPQGQMRMQARFAGDFSSAYQGQMTVEVQGPQGPMRQQMMLQSQYVGACNSN